MRGSGYLALSITIHLAVVVALWWHPVRAQNPAPTPAPLTGETFEVAEPEAPKPPEEPVVPAETTAEPNPAPAPVSPKHASAPPSAPSPSGASSGSSGNPSPPPFGAAGERAAVDLASAFTSAFPKAASTDPSWTRAPIGSAGSAVLTLEIDEAGRLLAERIQVDGSPSAPLRAGIDRTTALIAGHSFTAQGRRTRLHVTATISGDEVHDGFHGDTFAMGGLAGSKFGAGSGDAWFALPVGRRIDVHVKLTR